MINSDPDSDGNRCTMMHALSSPTYPSSFPPLGVTFTTQGSNDERKMK